MYVRENLSPSSKKRYSANFLNSFQHAVKHRYFYNNLMKLVMVLKALHIKIQCDFSFIFALILNHQFQLAVLIRGDTFSGVPPFWALPRIARLMRGNFLKREFLLWGCIFSGVSPFGLCPDFELLTVQGEFPEKRTPSLGELLLTT